MRETQQMGVFSILLKNSRHHSPRAGLALHQIPVECLLGKRDLGSKIWGNRNKVLTEGRGCMIGGMMSLIPERLGGISSPVF